MESDLLLVSTSITTWLYLFVTVVGFIACIVYRRISTRMWFLVFGMGGLVIAQLVYLEFRRSLNDIGFSVIGQSPLSTIYYEFLPLVSLGSWILVVIGLISTFGDLGRRIARNEAALRAEKLGSQRLLPSSVTSTAIQENR